MVVSYKKLWKLLIDRDMRKKNLQEAACLSPSSMAKLSKNENVSMDVLIKVCIALSVDFSDIMELVPNKDEIK
ncbi:helix-turn-helix transcriptional regulator [Sphingobacterium sp.]|uniref:helix-turn-helix domain-containing protein n=1 Tax=Sphingobacterium sp. TaxID=341027 RepID=UPI002899C752|nr:helix-turn-helix transcriptional regulator [Sphingobacterium sp.]